MYDMYDMGLRIKDIKNLIKEKGYKGYNGIGFDDKGYKVYDMIGFNEK